MRTISLSKIFKVLFSTLTIVALLAVSWLVFMTSASAANTFRNPLNSDHGSDPWMTYYNGQYYLTATTWSSSGTVGVTMKHASTIAGLIAATPERIFYDTTSSRCCNIWAPEFHLLNGPNGLRWYLYYVAGVSSNTDSQRMYVAESAGTDPLGPYTYKGQLAVGGPTDAWAVDPTIMQINGNLYLFYSAYEGAHYSTSQNIYGVALSNPWTVSGSPALISRPTYTWETGTAAVNEGPEQLTAPDGTIYLVFSATWCGNPNYQLGRSTYNGGPVLSQSSWVKYNGAIFTHANGQYSTAHNGFFKSPDGTEDWIVYHGVTSSGGACDNSRTTRIQKFTWNADNTPNLGAPLSLTTDINVPSGEGASGPTNTPGPTSTPAPTNTPLPGGSNIAIGATPSTSYVSSWENLNAINDGFTPTNSQDHSHGAYGNWNQTGTQWVEYDFGQNYNINQAAVYWWDDNQGIDMPSAGNLQYWNGSSYVNVPGGSAVGVVPDQYNVVNFTTVNTSRIRLQMTSNGTYSTGVIEFQVFSAGGSSPTNTPTRTNTPVGPTNTPTRTNTPVGPTNTPTNTATRTNTPVATPTSSGSGPLHWYTFDGNANDSGSSPANGTLNNGPTFVTGQNGQAVSLASSSSQYVSLPTGIVNGLTDFTIATWVNANTISTWARLFDFGSSTSVNMFLVPSNGSNIRFAITTGGWSAEQQINGTSALTTGWHHVAVTLSGTTGTLYVDGVQVGQNTSMTLNPSSLGSTTNNWIGRSQYSSDAYLNGQIDQFRIYNYASSATEIQALYQNP